MANPSKLLVFQIDNQRFALPLSVVRKVIQVVEFTPLPKMPEYIHGIINYHGDIIPVINMSFLFSITPKEVEITDRLIIASTSSGSKLAMLATVVRDIVEVNPDDIVKPEHIIYGMRFVQGVIKIADGMVLINDIDKFLSKEELMQLEEEINKRNTLIESRETGKEAASTTMIN